MELPNRKPNRLPDFDYSTPGAYFITICTQHRKNLLCKIVGGGALDAPQVQLTAMGENVEKNIRMGNRIEGITVDKYTVMPNHIHMILLVKPVMSGTSRAPSPTNALIPRFVGALKRLCHRQIGEKIFQRSYHDHVIRDERDYQKIWQYIDTNPAKWADDCFYNED